MASATLGSNSANCDTPCEVIHAHLEFSGSGCSGCNVASWYEGERAGVNWGTNQPFDRYNFELGCAGSWTIQLHVVHTPCAPQIRDSFATIIFKCKRCA